MLCTPAGLCPNHQRRNQPRGAHCEFCKPHPDQVAKIAASLLGSCWILLDPVGLQAFRDNDRIQVQDAALADHLWRVRACQ